MPTARPQWRPATRAASHPELVLRLAGRLQFAASDVTPCARADDTARCQSQARSVDYRPCWYFGMTMFWDALVLRFEVADVLSTELPANNIREACIDAYREKQREPGCSQSRSH